MSGQGIHKTALAGEQRQAAWELISGRESFTAAQIAQETGMSEPWARKVVREWHADGVIAAVLQDGQTTIWRAVIDPEPPSETAYARESRRPEFSMWRTMRDLRRFKAEDVLLTANTDSNPLTLPDVQKYCSTLAEAGFLRVAIKGRVGRSAVYTMIGRPGPFPPRQMRVPAVYDPNAGAFRILEKRVRP